MVDIRERIEEERGILKKIQLIIPGYEGYRRREDIRKADNLLRNQLADKLKNARNDIEDLRRNLVYKYETKNLEKIGSLLNYFQKIDGQLRHAEHGYSGISPAIRIGEEELNKLYEFDYSMAKIIAEISGETAKIKSMSEEEIPEEIERIRVMLEEFEKTFKMRMLYITGTEV
jgi:nitrogenase molybdenum-iron protein alpha/beta subunit